MSLNSGGNTTNGAAARRRGQGFTLIEVLIASFLTLVLIALLFGPLITGLRLTGQTQAATEAQDAARVALEQITREMGSAAAVRNTTLQYLDLDIYTEPQGAAPTETVAHAYNAYLDIIPPRGATAGKTYPYASVVDPTTGVTTVIRAKSGASNTISTPPVALPLGPGSTLIRYFVALRHPINYNYAPGGNVAAARQPYTNRAEGQTFARTSAAYGNTDTVRDNVDNTYILYRAQVTPYNPVASAGGEPTVNTRYFADDGSGNAVLDDPDFFRVVNSGDANPAGGTYTAATAAAHDARVYYWFQAARPVIATGDLNLLFQPHNGSGAVVYNNNAAGLPANTTLDTDGTPIVRTSVSFAPATVSNDPLNPTNNSDTAQGVGSAPGDAIAPFIPSEYRGSQGQWVGSANVVISEPTLSAGGATYGGNTYTSYLYLTPGGNTSENVKYDDLVERLGTTDVYDVSTNSVILGAGMTPTVPSYVAMTLDGADGIVNFALPDLPLGATTATQSVGGTAATTIGNAANPADTAGGNTVNPYWFVTYGPGLPAGSSLQIHLKPQPQFGYTATNPDLYLLPHPALTSALPTPNIAASANGHLVVNSERVFGPEQQPGPDGSDPLDSMGGTSNAATLNDMTMSPPSAYPLVAYHRVAFNPGAPLGYDQYMVDYDRGIIYLGTAGTNINVNDAYQQRRTVLVAFSYQNNDVIATAPTATGATTSDIAQAAPDTIRASYQSGSSIQVSIGLRVYSPSNGQPTYFSLTSAAPVGNAMR